MKHIKLFESFDINESNDPLLAILKKGDEAVPTELEQFLAEVEKKGPGTTGSEKALKKTFNQIARMTAPGSKPYENEKIFKYIKDKAKKQKIEIDMDAVEKFAKNTKGYTKKNEGAFSPEAATLIATGAGVFWTVVFGVICNQMHQKNKIGNGDSVGGSRIKKGLDWVKNSISSIFSKFKKDSQEVEAKLEKDGLSESAEEWIRKNIGGDRRLQETLLHIKETQEKGVPAENTDEFKTYQYQLGFAKQLIDKRMLKLKSELPEVAKIINDQISKIRQENNISENRIIKRFDDLK